LAFRSRNNSFLNGKSKILASPKKRSLSKKIVNFFGTEERVSKKNLRFFLTGGKKTPKKGSSFKEKKGGTTEKK
jgi:hypothetical protein